MPRVWIVVLAAQGVYEGGESQGTLRLLAWHNVWLLRAVRCRRDAQQRGMRGLVESEAYATMLCIKMPRGKAKRWFVRVARRGVLAVPQHAQQSFVKHGVRDVYLYNHAYVMSHIPLCSVVPWWSFS
jgi:hypothetical protein